MKLLVLLVTVALLPFTVPAAPAGQGDAAAAVAGAALAAAPEQPGGGTYAGSVIFSLTGAGKMVHLEGGPQPGAKPFKSVVKDADLLACIGGTGVGCDANSLDINPDEGAGLFLIFNSTTSWELANNAAGDDSVPLTGLVDGKGGFVMAGTHTSTDGDTHLVLTGKVKFAPGTLTPQKINGKLTVVSADEAHYGSGSFKAVPALQ